MSAKDHPTYRPDIDGLRAVAVLCVVIFHAFPKVLKGGFIGVDIFFVISGFLISTIIFKSLDAGTFSFQDFYSRRIRRIFPALLSVLIPCLIFGWFYMLTHEYKMLGKHVAAGSAFIANFALREEVGYFDISSDLKPMLHLWSLAIEEQFYIVWPLVLYFGYRLRLNFITIITVLIFASFAYGLYKLRINPTDAFYLPHLRAWELMIGSALAYATLYHSTAIDKVLSVVVLRSSPSPTVLANIKGIAGIALIICSAWFIKKGDSFPGYWALFPVIGATLIVNAGMLSWVNRKILANRWLVWIGLISYPLYLWHWPLLSFARIMEGGEPSKFTQAGLVLIAFVLAYATYALIEKRLRFAKSKAVTWILVACLAVVGAYGYYVYAHNASTNLSQYDKIGKAAGEWEFDGKGIAIEAPIGGKLVYVPSEKPGKVIFYGDSNIEQYWSRIDQLSKDSPEHVKSALFITRAGCPPILGIADAQNKECIGRNEYAMSLAKGADADTVVFAAAWWDYFGKPSAEILRYSFKGKQIHSGAEGFSYAMNSLSMMIADLKKYGKKVYMILNMPTGWVVGPRAMLTRDLTGATLSSAPLDLALLKAPYVDVQSALIKVATDAGAIIIDPLEFMCKDGKCPLITEDGEPIFKDSSHIRPSYARIHATFVDQTVLGK